MNKKSFDIKPYFITMIVSLIITFSIALISETILLLASEQKIISKELSKAIYRKFYTIEELENKMMKNKNDYVTLIKLAQKYNELEEYNSANTYFEEALKISDRSNLALYSYAIFCAERKLYNHALNMAEEISLDNNKTIKCKAKVYEKIAEEMDKDGEVEASIKSCQVAYKYAKKTYDKQELKNLKTNYAQEYIKLADKKIKNNELNSAILDLNNSINLKKLPVAKYKLALIYKNNKPELSEKLISEVLEENPYLVNPYIYNSIINDLIEKYKIKKIPSQINHYNSRIKTFNKLLNEVYVFKDDIRITNIDIIPKKEKLFGKKLIYLVFDIQNNTKSDINELYLLTEMYYSHNKIEMDKKIAYPGHALQAESLHTHIEMKIPSVVTKDNLQLAKDVVIKYYAKKQERAPWTLIKIQQLK